MTTSHHRTTGVTMVARLQFATVRRSVIRLHRRFPTVAAPAAHAIARFEARHAQMERLRTHYFALTARPTTACARRGCYAAASAHAEYLREERNAAVARALEAAHDPCRGRCDHGSEPRSHRPALQRRPV